MRGEGRYKYLAKNTLLFTFSSLSSKLIVFLLVPLYTSVLSTSDYGTADLITTTSNLLFFVFTLNISDAVLRFAIEDIGIGKGCLKFGLQVLFVGSFFFLTLSIIAWKINLVKWDDYCYIFLFLYYFFHALYQILNNFLRAADNIQAVAISSIISTIAMIGLNLFLLLVVDLGLIGYLIALVGGQLFAAVYCTVIIIRNIPGIFASDCKNYTKRGMLNYSIPLIFNGIAWWMNSSIDKYFVTAMLGTAANGVYAVSYKIPTILTVFQNIFSQAWNLSAIKEYNKEDTDSFFSKTYSFYNAALVIACSILILLNIPMARILYAKDFFIAWKYSSVLLFSIIFSALGGFVGSVFSAAKNSRIYAISTIVSAAANMILNFLLIPKYGVLGAAIATDISFVMIWAIRLICSKRFVHWKINLFVDLIAYVFLLLQIIIEHLTGSIILQIFVCFILIGIYHRYVISIVSTIYDKVKLRGGIKK